jgi:hypothetical protein
MKEGTHLEIILSGLHDNFNMSQTTVDVSSSRIKICLPAVESHPPEKNQLEIMTREESKYHFKSADCKAVYNKKKRVLKVKVGYLSS